MDKSIKDSLSCLFNIYSAISEKIDTNMATLRLKLDNFIKKYQFLVQLLKNCQKWHKLTAWGIVNRGIFATLEEYFKEIKGSLKGVKKIITIIITILIIPKYSLRMLYLENYSFSFEYYLKYR